MGRLILEILRKFIAFAAAIGTFLLVLDDSTIRNNKSLRLSFLLSNFTLSATNFIMSGSLFNNFLLIEDY